MNNSHVKIIPIGGLGEIGRNMMAIEDNNEIIIIDCGISFPSVESIGVDIGIPDMDFVRNNVQKIKALLVTHGHEDHIGAIPYLLSETNVPIYSSKLTIGLISNKLKNHGLLANAQLFEVTPHVQSIIGEFKIEFFNVCHSIPDAMGILITTSQGVIIHTGDFKIDKTPNDGKLIDFLKLSERASEGILALCSDSTYAEIPGHTNSEFTVYKAIEKIISSTDGRVIIATFASQISRIQQIINASEINSRKISVLGRSMINNVKLALQLGYLSDNQETLIPLKSLNKLPFHNQLIVTTGSQGEPLSAITKLAFNIHPNMNIQNGDTVILSSSAIPGNELQIGRNIDNLLQLGANVLYDKNSNVHVKGHASQEELKTMIETTRPKFFIPIHGEYRHLIAHSKIAQEVGISKNNVFVMKNGDILKIFNNKAEITSKVKAETLVIDGNKPTAISSNVFLDRKKLSRNGIVNIQVILSQQNETISKSVDINSLGLTNDDNVPNILKTTSELVHVLLDKAPLNNIDLIQTEKLIKEKISGHIYKEIKKKPLVLLTINRNSRSTIKLKSTRNDQ